MPEPTPPRRRRFQFGLGTMLLAVTAVAVLLGPGLARTRTRRAALREISDRGGRVLIASDPIFKRPVLAAWPIPTLPVWRRLCGDEAVYSITLPFEEFNGDDVDRFRHTFPE